ncbi:MAG: hypothetical protein WDM81_13025 [Rhizomicrobium sp.]
MSKTILIVSGGIEAADAARRAKEMGHYVVVSDIDHAAPGFAFADSCLIADVYGPSETAAAAERFSRKIRKIDGVICVAADAPVTAATVAQRLGLPGISLAAAELACDKLAMKRRFAERGVPVPWFDEIATPQALQRVAIERGNDLVIKPVDSRGSRGVQRVAQVADLQKGLPLRALALPDRPRDGGAISLRAAGLDRVGGGQRSLLHAGLLRPQLRISRALCAVLHREWRRPAQPSLPRDPAEGEGRGRQGGGCARHHERHREGRHRRPQGRALCHRTRRPPLRRLLLHAGNPAQHRRRFRRRGDPRRVGRDRHARGARAETVHPPSSSVMPSPRPAASSRSTASRRRRKSPASPM